MKKTVRTLAAGLVLATASLTGAAHAQDDIAAFYKGQTVTILIGHAPGGSYDFYSQLAARHLGRFIPGQPDVIVQSMPGGGGSLAAAHFANRAPNDGTVIALLPESLAANQLTEPEKTHWDMAQMHYIGRLNDTASVMMLREGAEAKSAADFTTIETAVSCTGTTSGSSQASAAIHYLADFKFRMVCGYDGSTPGILALLRGEVDANSTAWTTWARNQADDIKSGAIKPVIQFGLKPIKALPDVPMAMDLITDAKRKSAFAFWAASGEIGRSLLAPPNLDQAKYDALVKAFDDMVVDPGFLADAEQQSIDLGIGTGAEMEEAKNLILNSSPDDVALLKTALEEGFK